MYTYRLTSERTYNYSEWGLILGDRTSRVTNTARKRNCYITCIGTFFGSLFHIWNFWWELLYGKCQISSFRLTEQQVWFDVCDFKFLVEKSSLEFVSLFAKFVYNLYGFCVKWEWPRERATWSLARLEYNSAHAIYGWEGKIKRRGEWKTTTKAGREIRRTWNCDDFEHLCPCHTCLASQWWLILMNYLKQRDFVTRMFSIFSSGKR